MLAPELWDSIFKLIPWRFSTVLERASPPNVLKGRTNQHPPGWILVSRPEAVSNATAFHWQRTTMLTMAVCGVSRLMTCSARWHSSKMKRWSSEKR